MKILAMDSSGLVAGIAVVEDDNLIGEYTINYKKTHSQTLLPMLDEVAKMIELDLDSLDAIAVSAGPGSFTGLRIGSATAKGLGLALDKPLIHVPTVDALACNLWGCRDLVCPLMDARRNQAYTGLYRFAAQRAESNGVRHTDRLSDCARMQSMNQRLEIIRPQCAVGIDEIIEDVNRVGQPVVFLGDGVPVFSLYIEEHCQVPYSLAPAHMNRQRAGAVAYLGMQYAKEGKLESAAEHRPDYLRVSQAERERRQRIGQIHEGD
ncbi:MAG: tRNA (adenosine(37)-N6)-threonylcarbamoyltransferase complex dimerization subunit type 1 TsaB [Lachnospiraceae bacterium]|nr:tRNA (adenosine(37)-N6)-threonylcarbamoyltransferase complex dimerization subunit type 1 TsaB [Lachnospiraceae bacterium]